MNLMPPALPERLLRATVRDPEWRDAISGDLREEFGALAARHGHSAARRWYWRQSVPLAARFAMSRLVPSVAPARRRVSVADIEHTSSLGAGWICELRHAWRALLRRPGVSGTIVVTLGAALAANTVSFTLADALYLRPFRFAGVERVVAIASDAPVNTPFVDRESVAPADFVDWTRIATTVGHLVAVEGWDPNLSGVDVPAQIAGARVSAGFFDLLGEAPLFGRVFSEADTRLGAHRKAVLSHAFWVRQFGGDRTIVGQTIRLDGEAYEVTGVMRPRFQIPFGANVWVPLSFDEAGWTERRRGDLMVLGRLTSGATLEAARAEMSSVVARLAGEYPATNRGRLVTVRTLGRGLGDDGVGPFLAIFQLAAGLLLLIACANVANLLLAGGTERQPEFAVRLALGAGRRRLILQLATEGLCLALLATALGAALAALAVRAARGALPANVIRYVPGYDFLSLDPAGFAFTAVLATLATVLFALTPALQTTRAAVEAGAMAATRASTAGGGRLRLRSILAGAQVAFTLAVIVAATLLVGAVRRATDASVGFEPRHLTVAQLTLPERPYENLDRRRQFMEQVLARVRALPGVSGAAAVSTLPFSGFSTTRPFLAEAESIDEAAAPSVSLVRVTTDYFATLRIPLLQGRSFTEADRAGAQDVAIVSRSLAERHWPGGAALGRRFRLASSGPLLTVVGVSGDVTTDVFVGRGAPTVYRPWTQDPTLYFSVAARADAGDPTGDVRRAVAAADPDQPLLMLMSMEALMAERMAGIDFFAQALLVLSGLALVLALSGMYSLMAYLAARRAREIGVRVALGATRAQVLWLATSRAARITLAGLTFGVGLATAVSRAMQSALFGFVSPSVAVVTVATAVLALLALAAAFVPARRAAAQDPWAAIRTD